jgi:hypothetical protein
VVERARTLASAMKTTLSHMILGGSLVAIVASAPAQVGEDPPGSTLMHSMSFTLWRIGLSPAALSAGEQKELKQLVHQTRAALTALDVQFAGLPMPDDYERNLTAAALALSQVLVKSTLTRSDVLRLKIVSRDVQAKWRWAMRNPTAPFGPIEIAPVMVGGSGAASSQPEVLLRTLLDEAVGGTTAIAVPAGARKVSVVPGCHVFWLRSGGRAEFVADGSVSRVDVVMHSP